MEGDGVRQRRHYRFQMPGLFLSSQRISEFLVKGIHSKLLEAELRLQLIGDIDHNSQGLLGPNCGAI